MKSKFHILKVSGNGTRFRSNSGPILNLGGLSSPDFGTNRLRILGLVPVRAFCVGGFLD